MYLTGRGSDQDEVKTDFNHNRERCVMMRKANDTKERMQVCVGYQLLKD